MSYSEIAHWLTTLGYATKKSDLENAARPKSRLEPNLVPFTPVVANFIDRILEKFPAFQSEKLLLPKKTFNASNSLENEPQSNTRSRTRGH